jgi:hypothetical protein
VGVGDVGEELNVVDVEPNVEVAEDVDVDVDVEDEVVDVEDVDVDVEDAGAELSVVDVEVMGGIVLNTVHGSFDSRIFAS